MTLDQIDDFLEQVAALKTVTGVCGEGGESFTQYNLLVQFLRRATALGLTAGALTNASWVASRPQAEGRIAELMAAGLTNLGVSTDQYHQKSVPVERVDLLLAVCQEAGLSAARMETPPDGVMFRGRAAERLAPQMPTRPAEELASCPHEQLGAPSRVHLDRYGFLHLCQGLTLGRLPIADAVGGYDPESHPIVRLLLNGGPYCAMPLCRRPGVRDGTRICGCVPSLLPRQGVSAPPLPRSSRAGRDVRPVRATAILRSGRSRLPLSSWNFAPLPMV